MSIQDGYCICFNEWIFDKDIKAELGLLLIISSLSAEQGYCFAKNSYFAELFEIDEVSVSRKIKKLEDKGYITIEYEKKGCEIVNRKIRLTKLLIHDKQKCQSTINKNVKDNNKIYNNIQNQNDIFITYDYCEKLYNDMKFTFDLKEFWLYYREKAIFKKDCSLKMYQWQKRLDEKKEKELKEQKEQEIKQEQDLKNSDIKLEYDMTTNTFIKYRLVVKDGKLVKQIIKE